MGCANGEGQMLSVFLFLALLCLFSPLCISQRQKDEDHIFIKAENSNDAVNQSRHGPKTWTVPQDKQKYRDNTLPTALFFHLICLLLVHFIPSLNPSLPYMIPLFFPPSSFASFHPSMSVCVCVLCVWGALSACWLPGYQSNWGASRESLLSEPEPSVLLTTLILYLICSISLF